MIAWALQAWLINTGLGQQWFFRNLFSASQLTGDDYYVFVFFKVPYIWINMVTVIFCKSLQHSIFDLL